MAEEMQRAQYEARLYNEQLRLLQGEIERITMTSADLANSLRSIESLSEDSVFVPIGGGGMISAKISSTEVLVPIGGGYLMNLKKHEAVEEVKRRITSTEKAVERLRTEYEKIGAKYNEVSTKLETLSRKPRTGGM